MTALAKTAALETLSAHMTELRTRYSVKRIGVFGSVARGEAREGSDIDLLVEFEPNAHVGLFDFARLRDRLSQLLGCRVDLVTEDALHSALRERVLKETVHAS